MMQTRAERGISFSLRRNLPGMLQGCPFCGGPTVCLEKDPYDGSSWESEGYLILYCASCNKFFAMDKRHFFIDIEAWHGLVN